MKTVKKILTSFALLALGMAAGWGLATSQTVRAGEGYVLEHDADIAKTGAAPHNGPGRSTGYSFFEKATDFKQVFRKRVLHPGAAIGYHPQKEDEVYYILSGTGVMQMNGKEFPVKPGDAILTRPGSSHGLKQTGKDDLALIIVYEK
ncbi:MAG TPA: cupin domain-containing protein [Blastocatellia bacterium]|nr:cupin domain-containing protein [Blastocatellia bacterium]HMZ22311.1 cupin domain-containing protein [Blastocatellia bacterium]HNG29045.1 cupin domain-containing protein [Blastocatellia bacterium]